MSQFSEKRHLQKLRNAATSESQAEMLDRTVLEKLYSALHQAREVFYHSGIFKERKGLIGRQNATRETIEGKFPMPLISYNQRGKIAGTAYLQKWEIRLNPVLLVENGETFIEEVVPHELAHLLTFRLFGGTIHPHGKEWRWMMEKVLGVPANRTHSFDVSSVQGRRFRYRCSCKEHYLSIIRHNRVERKKARYSCQRCGEILMFVQEACS